MLAIRSIVKFNKRAVISLQLVQEGLIAHATRVAEPELIGLSTTPSNVLSSDRVQIENEFFNFKVCLLSWVRCLLLVFFLFCFVFVLLCFFTRF